MSSIQFELKSALEYSHNNSQQEANFIELKEPTGKVSHLCCDIESMIQSGIMAMSGMIDEETMERAKLSAEAGKPDKKAEDKNKDEAPDPEASLSIMSGGGDMKKIAIAYRELFKEVAFVGGEKQMTIPLIDRMNHKDFRQMMGVYTANFILG